MNFPRLYLFAKLFFFKFSSFIVTGSRKRKKSKAENKKIVTHRTESVLLFSSCRVSKMYNTSQQYICELKKL